MVNFLDNVLDITNYSCQDSTIFPLFEAAKFVITIIQIAVPFALVIWGSLDFFKALISADEKEMRMKRKPFISRLVAAVIILMLPWIVQLIARQVAGSGDAQNFWICYSEAKPRIDFSSWANSTVSGGNGVIGGNGAGPTTTVDVGTGGSPSNSDGGTGWVAPTGRQEVSSCSGLSQNQCNSAITSTHKCKWTGAQYGCQNGETRDTYKNSCSDFITQNSCNAGMTSTYTCQWQQGRCTEKAKR